jgi:hypothetical protein
MDIIIFALLSLFVFVLGFITGKTIKIEKNKNDFVYEYDEDYFNDDFEEISFPFIVGDRVRVMDDFGIKHFSIGDIVEVTKTSNNNILSINGLDDYLYDNSCYELVPPSTPLTIYKKEKSLGKKLAKKVSKKGK